MMQQAEIMVRTYCADIPFEQMSDCTRRQFDTAYPGWPSDRDADLTNLFLLWSHTAAQRVAEGSMSEARAWQLAGELEAQLDQIAAQRTAGDEARATAMAAAINHAGQQIAQPLPAPRPSIACTSTRDSPTVTSTTCQ